MATENIYTGRRPKDVMMGTLYRLISNGRIDHVRSRMNLPDKITESQNQNADASELHGLCESTMEVSDVEWKLRRSARGPNPCEKVTKLDAVIAEIFHQTDQFRGSAGSSLG